MLRFFGCAMALALVSLSWAARPATTSKKAPVKKSTSGKTPVKTASKKSTGKNAPARKATTWRNRQLAPTADRYRAIQEALAAKGYLRPEDATGSWSANSVEALKRFQADQNIDGSGKINSLSLIALGLGPKREAVVLPPPPPQGQ
jgi:hypothetical protein